MRLIWSQKAWDSYLYWQRTDRKTLNKINELIRDCMRTPLSGIGKPEPLKGELTGFWSRRITREHRLVYRITEKAGGQAIEIASCRYHYE